MARAVVSCFAFSLLWLRISYILRSVLRRWTGSSTNMAIDDDMIVRTS